MKPRLQLKQTVKVKLSVRTRLIYAAAGVAIIGIITGIVLFLYFNLGTSEHAEASVAGDYRTMGSGNWNGAAVWQKYNGSTWVSIPIPPSSGDGVIEVRSGHTVTLTADVTADQIIVDAGGTLNINSAEHLYVANGTGVDLEVDGSLNLTAGGNLIQNNSSTVEVNGTFITSFNAVHTISSGSVITINSGGKYQRDGGTISNSGKLTVSNGATYQHNMNGGIIPTAGWNTGSTCVITGATNLKPGGMTQPFYNFSWNSLNQTGVIDLQGSLSAVNGDLNLISTGSSYIQFDKLGDNKTLIVGGNLNVQGGAVYCCTNGSNIINVSGNYVQTGGNFCFNRGGGTVYGNTSTIMTISGNVTISGGTLDLSRCDANNPYKGIGQLYLAGNLAISGTGLMTEGSALSHGEVYFNGTTLQYFTSSSNSNISKKVNVTVNSGAILRMDNNVLTGDGTFALLSGAGLMMGSAAGITTSGASGNVQVTGTRSYNTGADYTYNGTVAQSTGSGLPSTVHNLTLNNSNGLTLTNTVAISNLLYLTSGKLTTGNSELSVTNNSPTAIAAYSGTAYINGKLRRTVPSTGSYDFPVGSASQYELATVVLHHPAAVKNFLVSFTNPHTGTTPLPNVCTVNGNPIMNLLDYGFWNVTPDVSFISGTYDLTLKERGYNNGAASPGYYTIVTRANPSLNWVSFGTHNSNTQSEAGGTVTAVRASLGVTGNFAIGISNTTLRLQVLNFNATAENNSIVHIIWQTASENPDDYFVLQRTADQKNWENLDTVNGSGSGYATKNYTIDDSKPLTGESYYRLKQCSGSYSFEYSNEVLVKINGTESIHTNDFKVYPNPSHGLINVSISDVTDETLIRVFDIKGSLIKEIKPAEGTDAQIDLTGKQPGIYLIKVGNGGANDVSKQIVLTQ